MERPALTNFAADDSAGKSESGKSLVQNEYFQINKSVRVVDIFAWEDGLKISVGLSETGDLPYHHHDMPIQPIDNLYDIYQMLIRQGFTIDPILGFPPDPSDRTVPIRVGGLYTFWRLY